MTSLGKTIITGGIIIFTLSSLCWIVLEDWHWFAGGGAIFLGSLLSGAILSVETKDSRHTEPQTVYRPYRTDNPPTAPIPKVDAIDDWRPPNTPPPDDNQDPFYNKPNPSPRVTLDD